MATNSAHTVARKAVALLAVAAALAAVTASLHASPPAPASVELDADDIGNAGHVPDSAKPKLTAFFPRQSYARGATAQLVIDDSAPRVTLQIRHAGADFTRVAASDVMTGEPVSPVSTIGTVRGRRIVSVRLGDWPSGLYFAELRSGARIGYAPFVLRPRRLGEHSVAIVLPTQTWQAYNFRDDDGDGRSDTWYDHGSTARLARAFLNRGVPPHYKHYDMPFVRWAYLGHHDADYLSDADVNAVSGAKLRAAYRLVVFEGHHEYVTSHEYDAVTRFRDAGGNLMFLSANNFFWKITIRGNVMTRVAKWRDLGRPEAGLIGVQYFHNDMGEHRGPWVVQAAAARLDWLLRGTNLRVGMRFGSGGIEADTVTPASPRGVKVIAKIPNLYGTGVDADMTYYETPAGAKVFAAGAFTIAGSAWNPQVRPLIENLWEELGRPVSG